jgi:hypothetical protein
MRRVSKASTRALRALFSFVRYSVRFSIWAMYSIALERMVAYSQFVNQGTEATYVECKGEKGCKEDKRKEERK